MKRQGRVFMWLDNASDIDILFYEPYARIIADIAKNEQSIDSWCVWIMGCRKINLIEVNR